MGRAARAGTHGCTAKEQASEAVSRNLKRQGRFEGALVPGWSQQEFRGLLGWQLGCLRAPLRSRTLPAVRQREASTELWAVVLHCFVNLSEAWLPWPTQVRKARGTGRLPSGASRLSAWASLTQALSLGSLWAQQAGPWRPSWVVVLAGGWQVG